MNSNIPAALITGASSGIGKAFALALARRRTHHLLLAARRTERLHVLADEIEQSWQKAQNGTPEAPLRVHVLPCDLCVPDARLELFKSIESLGLFVQTLINNAGFGSLGPFAEADPEWEARMVQLNCAVPLLLTRHFIGEMYLRKSGCVINVCSTAAFQPMPYMATYGSTKAFLLNFSLAVAAEAASKNVLVMAHCPGPTESEFHLVVGLNEKIPHIRSMSAEVVVEETLDAAARGSNLVINGFRNKLLAQVSRFLPRSWQAYAVERVLRQTRGEHAAKS